MSRRAAALLLAGLVASTPAVADEGEAEAPRGPRWETPEDLKTLLEAFERFEAAAASYRQEVQLLVEQKYEERRTELSRRYEQAIENLEVVERAQRLDAIARFEEFVARYPEEPAYTPDAIMRLAELYYEQIEDDHRLAERAFYAHLETLPPGEEPGPAPTRRFDRPIALYQRIIDRFPDYRYADAAYYLVGYLRTQQDEFDEALAVYDALIERFPHSRFVPEVWMRIGEYYFDADLAEIPDALERAIAAYHEALVFEDHHLYDKVLYKLAWTYYRINAHDEAVSHFLDLLAHYQAVAEAEGEEVVGGDLREEAIQYAAASFAEDGWGSFAKAKAYMADRGHPDYEFDVMRRLGEIYFDITRYPASVEALEYVLERFPLHRDAPVIQERIVRAWERDRALAEAFDAQQALVTNYSRGSAWYVENRGDDEAIGRAEEIIERSLYATALFRFEQAQTFRQDGEMELAIREYERAAEAIYRYLELFPHTQHLYDLEFYLADSYFWTGRFVDAGDYFSRVRDSNLDVEFQEPAALGAVESYEREIARLERAGRLEARPILTSKDWPDGEAVAPMPLPELYARLVEASDMYVRRLPDHERTPAIAYEAALTYYRHHHFPEARKRFEELVERWPSAEASAFAANLIIESFLIEEDWESVEKTSERLLASQAVQEAGGEVVETFLQFKLGGRFRRAVQLMDEARYEEAADLFLALVAEAPDHRFADTALFNAALSYEEMLRFETALGVYERVFREYPDSELADQALFLVAFNAQKAFDYEQAIARYMRLVDDYPDSPQHEAAMFNAGTLLYYMQRYDEAARQFHRFARAYPDSEDTPRLLLRAADAQEKQGNPRGAIAAYQEFIRRYQNDENAAGQVVEARLQIARAHRRMNADRQALAAYRATVDEFERQGLPDDDPAVLHAAEAQFMIAEAAFAEYDALRIAGTGTGARLTRSLEQAINAKMSKALEVQGLYEAVYRYPHPEYVLAAAYRQGYVLERFAQSLYDAPVPPQVERAGEEYVWAYQGQLAEAAYPLEEQAVEMYVAAAERARALGIVNEWSRRTLESLSRYRPDEYPVLKEARDGLVEKPLSPLGLAPSLSGLPGPPAAGTRLGDDEDAGEDLGPRGAPMRERRPALPDEEEDSGEVGARDGGVR
jgi:cellulose synthase operon protein C